MGRFCFGFVKKGFKVSVLCEYEEQNKVIVNKAGPTRIRCASLSSGLWWLEIEREKREEEHVMVFL